jgi:hypothetical protein
VKSGQSSVRLSYSPPSPQTLLPYVLLTWTCAWHSRRVLLTTVSQWKTGGRACYQSGRLTGPRAPGKAMQVWLHLRQGFAQVLAGLQACKHATQRMSWTVCKASRRQ